MASKRNPQTAAKRDREQAVRERRKLKQDKKQAAAAARRAPDGEAPPVEQPRPY